MIFTTLNVSKSKAFTLFELVIVVVLVSLLYYFAISNFNIQHQKLATTTISNLKDVLSQYGFNNKVELKCTDNGQKCMILRDGVLQKDKITNLFKSCPDVYEYSTKLDRIEYPDLEFEQLERYEICFEYYITKDGTTPQMIVDNDEDGVYIFDNIHPKPSKIKYLNDISIYFDDKIKEVKDAF